MRRAIIYACLAVSCLAVAGCKVTPEDIDYWTGTQKGPGKIVAVLLADKYEDELRAYAGLALVRMEPRPPTESQDPVDGVSELQAAMRQLDEETRARLVDQMVPELVRIMRGEDAPQAQASEEEGVPRRQVRAKDAAFLLLPYASRERRQEMIDAVVDWFVVDFNGRSLEGTYTAEQVVRQLGAPAASRLVNAINARLPQPALVKLAELIASLGDGETKQRAATRLVEVSREMEGEDFMNWLKERLREQLRQRARESQQPAAEIDETRVTNAAIINRESFINLGALPALKHLNSERVVQDRLLEIASAARTEAAMLERRKNALLALEGGTRADQVEAILDIALIAEPPPGENRAFDLLRDAAFDRVSDSRSTAVLPRLWQVFAQTNSDRWRARWVVGKVILTLGGNDVVQEFFNRLDDNEYAREELYNYGERLSQMRPPPTDFINTQLESRDWYDRVIALYFWEKRAEAADIARITALSTDSAATAGEHWRDQNTVGKVAEAVANAVRERLSRAQAEARAPAGEAPAGAAAGG